MAEFDNHIQALKDSLAAVRKAQSTERKQDALKLAKRVARGRKLMERTAFDRLQSKEEIDRLMHDAINLAQTDSAREDIKLSAIDAKERIDKAAKAAEEKAKKDAAEAEAKRLAEEEAKKKEEAEKAAQMEKARKEAEEKAAKERAARAAATFTPGASGTPTSNNPNAGSRD